MSVDGLFRCPACSAQLTATNGVSPSLACTSCAVSYPIVGGIPRFVTSENYASNFGFQWNRFRQTQLDSHSGSPISRDRFVRSTGWTDRQLAGKRVLDVGCGAGRFAEIALSLGASVVGVDYSAAVDACRANLPDTRLEVVQANVYALPFAAETFDFVYCLGVIQHTPDVAKAVAALARQVKPGGELVVDAYMRHWKAWMHPRIWLRPITTRMDPQRLFATIERNTPALLRVSDAIGRIPGAGRHLRRLVPVANYRGQLPLSDAQLREWAVLDTFDWLSPAYDQPQTAATLERWLTDAGLEDVRVFRADHLTARGRKPGRIA